VNKHNEFQTEKMDTDSSYTLQLGKQKILEGHFRIVEPVFWL
jgi:RNA binding exosome subunit